MKTPRTFLITTTSTIQTFFFHHDRRRAHQRLGTHSPLTQHPQTRTGLPHLLQSTRAWLRRHQRRLNGFLLRAGCGYLDHDQRNTLHVGGQLYLPWRSYLSTDVYYGSGFTNGNPPPDPNNHLPGHTTFDLTLGKSFGERFSLGVTCLNVTNLRVLLDIASRLAERTTTIHARYMGS